MFLTMTEAEDLKNKLISYEDQVDFTPLGEERQDTVDVPLTARQLIGLVDIINYVLALKERDNVW